MATRKVPNVLGGARVVEHAGSNSAAVTRVAVSFAGRLLAAIGGEVMRVLPGGGDPLAGWPPFLPDGTSALHRFLTAGKTESGALPDGPADLITDDPGLAADWSAGSTVLVEGTGGGTRHAHSELTVLAASGLLDIFGEPGRPPLPLPGHQAAYAAGVAAFNALISARFANLGGRHILRSRVSVLDVAVWLNWKYFLAAHLNQPNWGIGRREDWRTYRCRDGHVAFIFQDRDLPKIAELAGEDRIRDPKFANLKGRVENLEEFQGLIAPWLAGQSRDDIVAKAQSVGIPIGPVLRVDELPTDRQMLARDFIDMAKDSPSFGQPSLPVLWRRANESKAEPALRLGSTAQP